MKQIAIAIIVLLLVGAGVWWFTQNNTTNYEQPEPDTTETTDDEPMPVEPDEGIGDGAEPLPALEPVETIGQSVEGTAITAHHFGSGDTEVLLVGGVHGGYSPNTAALAEDLVEYYEENEDNVPEGVMLTIIPNLNPDGSTQNGAAGRFNANDVDLNRNFDCEWSATGMWQDREVSGGDAPFSEPEARALRDYVESRGVDAAIVWFSQEGKVYPSACGGTPSNASVVLASTFATAAGYPAEAEFDAYAITGDMVNWMASEGIPAISVLLSDHQSPELAKNLAGVEAVLNSYSQ
jgi:hypothetical protein